MAQTKPRDAREFDIVIYGATGYTGRLVAEYLSQHYADRAGKYMGQRGVTLPKL